MSSRAERASASAVEGPAEALQRNILSVIHAWHERDASLSDDEFSELALRIFGYQLQHNAPYARYCAAKAVTLEHMPRTWREIPPVPSAAYKEKPLTTFDPANAALVFETSGTTQGAGGKHYMESSALYDAALLAGFDRFVLADGARLRYLNLAPNPKEKPHSSLGYMMGRVTDTRGVGPAGWYLRGDALLTEEFFSDLRHAIANGQPVCVATTAFALVTVLDAAASRDLRFSLPPGSRIMETGGFKGRARVVSREELYARACACFGIADSQIIAEYGMTELTSQWYDTIPYAGPSTSALRASARDDKASASAHDKASTSPHHKASASAHDKALTSPHHKASASAHDKASTSPHHKASASAHHKASASAHHKASGSAHDKASTSAHDKAITRNAVLVIPSAGSAATGVEGLRIKASPTWLRARAVAPDGATLPDGVVGALAHVDLANLSSCVAVQTEDLGACFGDEIVLIGREQGAELRGCSLDAETLAAR